MRPSTPPPTAAWTGPVAAVLYVGFALVSTALNLGTQEIAVEALDRTSIVLPASILCGTLVGFVSKYLLDKHLVFMDASTTERAEFRKVMLYALFSMFTTAIFWGAELAAYAVAGTASAKFEGAVAGLAVGYALKFGLDRRYTFGAGPPRSASWHDGERSPLIRAGSRRSS